MDYDVGGIWNTCLFYVYDCGTIHGIVASTHIAMYCFSAPRYNSIVNLNIRVRRRMKEFLYKSEINLVDKNKCQYAIGQKGEVVMTLPSGNRRQIGQLITTSEEDGSKLIYVCHRKQALHMMRVNNSYGVNEFIVNQFKPDMLFFFIDDTGEKYSISREEFEKKSSYLHFRNQGFELQRFIQINSLTSEE